MAEAFARVCGVSKECDAREVVCVSSLASLCARGTGCVLWCRLSVFGPREQLFCNELCISPNVGDDVQANPPGARGGASVDESGACGNERLIHGRCHPGEATRASHNSRSQPLVPFHGLCPTVCFFLQSERFFRERVASRATLTPPSRRSAFPQVVSARGTRFVYASTLALYAHDRDDYSLSSIPVTQTETLSAFDWRVSINGNETDAFLVCTNDDVIRVYTSGDGGTGSSPTLTHTMKFQSFGVRFVSWDQHRGDVFLVVAGNSLYKVTLNGNGTSATTTKQPWPNQGVVTCFTRHPSNNRQCAVGTKTGSAWLFDAESGRSVPLSRLFQGEIADVQVRIEAFPNPNTVYLCFNYIHHKCAVRPEDYSQCTVGPDYSTQSPIQYTNNPSIAQHETQD